MSTTPSFPDSKKAARTHGSQPRGFTRSMTLPPLSLPPHDPGGVVLTLLIIVDATCEASSPSFQSMREEIAQTRTLRYRLLRSLFATSEHWKSFDPFFTQKLNTYQASGNAVHRMKPSLSVNPPLDVADR
jgi:hypothetical protein